MIFFLWATYIQFLGGVTIKKILIILVIKQSHFKLQCIYLLNNETYLLNNKELNKIIRMSINSHTFFLEANNPLMFQKEKEEIISQ